MNIKHLECSAQLRPQTEKLLRTLLNPMVGINQHIGCVLKSANEPRIITVGAELTGVHMLAGIEYPGPGAYHVGGSGCCEDEALIKTLGESIERYAHFAVVPERLPPMVFQSFEQMLYRGGIDFSASVL